MWPFESPDIEKLKAKSDIKGLVKALGHRKRSVRDAAALLPLSPNSMIPPKFRQFYPRCTTIPTALN